MFISLTFVHAVQFISVFLYVQKSGDGSSRRNEFHSIGMILARKAQPDTASHRLTIAWVLKNNPMMTRPTRKIHQREVK